MTAGISQQEWSASTNRRRSPSVQSRYPGNAHWPDTTTLMPCLSPTHYHPFSNENVHAMARQSRCGRRSVKIWLEVGILRWTESEQVPTTLCDGHHLSSAKGRTNRTGSNRCSDPARTRMLCCCDHRRLVCWALVFSPD